MSTFTLGLTDVDVELCVDMGQTSLAETVYTAVLPEVSDWPGGSITVQLRTSAGRVCAYIHGDRISDVRAALNSVGSWLHVAATLVGDIK